MTEQPMAKGTEFLRRRAGGALLTNSPLAVAVIAPDLRLLWTNAAFESTFEGRPEQRCHRVYKGRDKPCNDCRLSRVWRDGCPATSQEQGVTRDKRLIAYQVHHVPLLDRNGKAEYAVQIVSDQTRLKELEAGLDRAERLATVGMTAAGLAHTIKNILAGLNGGTYIVESGFKQRDESRSRAGWEMVRKYLDQVQRLVRNLLDYSRPRAPQRSDVNPGELVRDVVRLFEKTASLAGANLEGRVAPDLAVQALDWEALHAALANLVANAVDACRWDPDLDKVHRIVVAVERRSRGGVVFEVRDNGTGIAEQYQEKVLVALFTSKGVRGTGLGLLLTKKAVHEHGGRIEFSSTPGRGTTFRFEIPARAKGAAS